MKVLQINTVSSRGSVGRIALDLYQVIEKNNGECVIAYGRDDAPENINNIKVNSKLDFYASVIRTFVTGEHGFGLKRKTHKLIEKIEEYNPDVIHIHNLHGFYVNVEILFEYIKEKNIPVVWTLHDCWSFTGHCAYFDYVKCNKWQNGCSNCPQYKTAYPYGLLHDNSKNNFARKKKSFSNVENMTIVAPCNWLKDLVNKSYLKYADVRVIYNGIDLEKFKPVEVSDKILEIVFEEKSKENKIHKKEQTEVFQKNKEKKLVLGVANVWENRKGLKYFEELADILSDDYQIVLVGLSEKQIKSINPKIKGITRTSNVEELAQLYTLADVYVNTTMEDNFPTTNLESLACGTPVVTFRTGGSIEAIDETCGKVVEQEDVCGLKSAIESFCVDNIDKDTLKQACLERARMFDKKERFLEYFDLYKEVINNGK